MIEEIFKPVKGYEGFYEISNLGRVKSVLRVIQMKDGRTKTIKEKILIPNTNQGGYKYVNFFNGKTKTVQIHLLVWDAFGNLERNGRAFLVDHKDGCKTNNFIDNLQPLTARENTAKGFHQLGKELPTGVSYHKRDMKYRANVQINGVNKHLGYFNTALEASLAYQKALRNDYV